MKTFTLAAALLMAGSAAHAGQAISLEIDGHKIRIEAPKNCDALTCLKITGLAGINLGGLMSGRSDDDDTPVNSASPAPAPAPAIQATSPQPTFPQSGSLPPVPPAPPTIASAAPASPALAANPPPAAAPQAVAAAAPAPTTPLGLWATEENKGNVRIEQCGIELCGYAEKSGEKILINMRPSDNEWVGRIHDPKGGSNYESTIAMKGPNLLKVQGCAFGGLFCGGQTWKRLS